MHTDKSIKKILLLLIVLCTLSGCTKIDNNLDSLIDAVSLNTKVPANTASTSYELFIPTGVKQSSDSEYNQKFKIRNRYIYLYVDTISYFYKNETNNKSTASYSYYYKELNVDDRTGYIGINQIEEDLYYCEIVFNYSKIEFYSNMEDLNTLLANSLIIIKSIKYNDQLISVELDNKIKDGRELKYELDSPKDSKSTFSDYIQEFVPKEEPKVELPKDD